MKLAVSRDWATPLTIGAFGLMAATGLLMFFHADRGLNKLAHEWLGWVMVGGVGLHAWVNWAAFRRHLAGRTGRVIVGVSVLAFAASFGSMPGGEQRGASPPMLALRAVLQAPLRDLAPLAGRSAEALQAELQAGGIEVSLDQPLHQVTAGDREREARALNVLFGGAMPPPGDRP